MCLSIEHTPEMRIDRVAACLLAFNSTPLVYSGARCQIRADDYWIIFHRKKETEVEQKRKKWLNTEWIIIMIKAVSHTKKELSTIGVANAYYIYKSARPFPRIIEHRANTFFIIWESIIGQAVLLRIQFILCIFFSPQLFDTNLLALWEFIAHV